MSLNMLEYNVFNYLVTLGLKWPTGHRSITFPDNSDRKILSTYVPISVPVPLLKVPKSSTPAISEAKRTHRVQWIQRVITVLTMGPKSLSLTTRLNL